MAFMRKFIKTKKIPLFLTDALSVQKRAVEGDRPYGTLLLIICVVLFSISAGCSIYSFSGSTLPSHIKTAEIPIFENTTLEPGINDEITAELSREILRSQLRPANQNADATISGTVTRYENVPQTFGAGGAEVQVERYIVRVAAEVLFVDNIKNETIYKGTVSGEGLYNFDTEDEAIGREKAVKNLVEKIIQNSVQMW